MAGTFAGTIRGTIVTLLQVTTSEPWLNAGFAIPSLWWFVDESVYPVIKPNGFSVYAGAIKGVRITKTQAITQVTYSANGFVFGVDSWKIEDGTSYPYIGNTPILPPSDGNVPKVFARPMHSIKVNIGIGFRVGI